MSANSRIVKAMTFGNAIPVLIIRVANSLKMYLKISNKTYKGYGKTKHASKNKPIHLSGDRVRKLNAIMAPERVKIINKKKSANRIHNSAW